MYYEYAFDSIPNQAEPTHSNATASRHIVTKLGKSRNKVEGLVMALTVIGVHGIDMAAYDEQFSPFSTASSVASTAVHKEAAAEPTGSSGTLIPSGSKSFASTAVHEDAVNPYMACVHEEHPRHCCSHTPRTKLLLALLATVIVLALGALGIGVYFAVRNGTSVLRSAVTAFHAQEPQLLRCI
jgi:hypothetical protein